MSAEQTSAQALQRIRVAARSWSVEVTIEPGWAQVVATPGLLPAADLAYGAAVDLPADDPRVVALAEEEARASRVSHRALLLVLARPDSPLRLPETFTAAARAMGAADKRFVGDEQVKAAREGMTEAARAVSHAWTVSIGSSQVGSYVREPGIGSELVVVCDVSDSPETQAALTGMVTEALTESARQEIAWEAMASGEDVPLVPSESDDDRPAWVRQVTA